MRKFVFLITFVVIALAAWHFANSTNSATNTPNKNSTDTLTPASGSEMVLIPSGEFSMGTANRRPDETPHKVAVDSFYMDRVTVTQELYERIVGSNPSRHKDKKCPVEHIQWIDAVRFCNKCSEMDGLKPCYNLQSMECDFSASGYRLPTEAEWEYACRAGSVGQYSFGDDPTQLPKYAWLKPHSGGQTHPVGTKAPNAWGLFDMHGNIWQWCNDYYDEKYYATSPHENPHGPASGQMRVLRGGSWDSSPEKCTSSYRFKEFPTFADACFGADTYGFRRVKTARPVPGGGSTPTQTELSSQPSNGAGAGAAVNTADAAPKSVEQKNGVPGKLDVSSLKGTVVFVSDRTGTLNIWSMQANGKSQHNLTPGSNPCADPRYSPDGKRILFTSVRGGFPEVWIMNRDGSNPSQITQGCQGSWSPDGASIVFIRDNQTYVRELQSGKERRVTPESWERCGVPAWSPDGKHIAVASRHTGTIGIFMVTADGKDVSTLATGEASCTPRWSSDGKHLLCQSVKGHVHQVDADGRNWQQVTIGADIQHQAVYSPDGTQILFCRAPAQDGPWQICVMNLDDEAGDFAPLTSEGSNSAPDWSPIDVAK